MFEVFINFWNILWKKNSFFFSECAIVNGTNYYYYGNYGESISKPLKM